MKKLFIICSVLLIIASAVVAGESSCPADRASKIGFDPFGDFHHLLAPVWHNAWPEKDYETLLAAGPEFVKLFEPIAKMNPKLKSVARVETFKKNREAFGKMVVLFADACKNGDKEKAYSLMPDVHDTFEMTASALLPLHYPEFDGFIISFNLLNENHIPSKNIDGINGTVETLIAKLNGLTDETIPVELQEKKDQILIEFTEISKLVTLLKECCDKNEMEQVSVHAEKLSVLLDSFVEKFI